MRRFGALWMLAAALASAQGTKPREKATDYPVSGIAGTVGIGADFLIHSFSGGEQTFYTQDYVVVEVALYPQRGDTVAVSASDFTLRVNGKKQVLGAQAPGMVAYSLRNASYGRPGLQMGAGVGGIGVDLGGPRGQPRFPGDDSSGQRQPQPPRAPDPNNPGAADRREPVTPESVLTGSALPEGLSKWPVSGYLYFPYAGKISKLKSVELICPGAALRLR